MSDLLIRAGELAAAQRPYALATVVNVVRPASTRRGDRALVTPDGTLEGWVGGACSEPVVVREALRALADGETRLVRICPPGGGVDAPADVVVAESSCASEGVVEVLVEPCLPAPLLAVVGDGVAARTLGRLAADIGWRVTDEPSGDADAVVVASMGHGDADALGAALAGPARYIGLVASARRAGVVLAELPARGRGVGARARGPTPRARAHGGARPAAIAVAILAQLVAWRHTTETPSSPPSAASPGPCCHEA